MKYLVFYIKEINSFGYSEETTGVLFIVTRNFE